MLKGFFVQIFFLLTNRSVRHLACVQLLQQYIFSLGYKNSLLLFLGVHEKYNALAPSLSSPLPPPQTWGIDLRYALYKKLAEINFQLTYIVIDYPLFSRIKCLK